MKQIITTLLATAATLAVGTAHAATIHFTDTSVGSLIGTDDTSLTIHDDGTGIDVTVTATDGYLYHETGDGLGVYGSNDRAEGDETWEYIDDDWGTTRDEIDQNETITIDFSENGEAVNVNINSIGISDMYDEWSWVPDETGSWQLFNSDGDAIGGAVAFDGIEDRFVSGGTSNGERSLDIQGLLAASITLTSTNQMAGYEDGSPYKGFSLASVSFDRTTSVPELSASGSASSIGLLIGAGILIDQRRRRHTLGGSV